MMPAARTRRKRSLQAAGLGRQSAGASTTKPSRIRRKAGMARCVAQVGIRMGATQTVGADDLPPVPVAPRLDAGRRLHPDRPCHGRSAHATVSRHFPPTRRRGGQDGAVAFARDWIPRNWTSFIPSSSARSCSPSSCRRSRHALASTPRTRVHATHSRHRSPGHAFRGSRGLLLDVLTGAQRWAIVAICVVLLLIDVVRSLPVTQPQPPENGP